MTEGLVQSGWMVVASQGGATNLGKTVAAMPSAGGRPEAATAAYLRFQGASADRSMTVERSGLLSSFSSFRRAF